MRHWWRATKRMGAGLAMLCLCGAAWASEYHGQVLFNGLPVPGATVTATQGDKTQSVVTDQQGAYSFADLPDGSWKIHVEMQAFASLDEQVTIAANQPAGKYELKLLSLPEIMAQATAVKVEDKPAAIVATPTVVKPADAAKKGQPATPDQPKPAEEPSQQANDGLLINGSVNNASTSQFTLAPAFGNQRSGVKSLYTGGLSAIIGNSVFNANSYSVTGLNSPKPSTSQVTLGAAIGGPIRIPHLMPRGPNFFVNYQWTRNGTSNTTQGLVPTANERTAASPEAQSLLQFYPLPNVTGSSSGYNYQIPLVSNTHQDAMQLRLDKTVSRKDQLYGTFAFQSTRLNNTNLFGFVDTTDVLGLRASANWNHHFSSRLFLNTGYTFSRQRSEVKPYFEDRQNVDGSAGITGYDNDPAMWGPPSLSFTTSGIYGLSDANSAFNRNRTEALSPVVTWYRRKHNFTFGGDFRRQEYNYYQQSNPRGVFQFTSANGLTDFQNFLNGTPTTAQVDYGNPDKYLRQSVYDLYGNDDWRLLPQLTINAGVRWEYGAPMTELKGRLANYLLTPDFSSYTIVTGQSPQGLPTSLIHPDKTGVQPRIGISWRPIPGSTLVIRAGYGVNYDTSVYQATAISLAQQSPWATSVSNTGCSLNLATALKPICSTTLDPTAVDPNFRVGYAQSWQLSAQRDLPFAMQMVATYLGIKGTRGVQQFYPNTYPAGGSPLCTTTILTSTSGTCPIGFTYRTSNGDSTREQGSFQLRRRLRSGFTATALYTYSKSLDDDAVLGGQGPVSAGATGQNTSNAATAQNWLNLRGERGRSTFDQRNLLNATIQYTSGMGIGGGTLLTGWRGRVLKDWTLLGTFVVGSGLPETPTYPVVLPGTTSAGVIRPNLTGASVYAAPAGLHLNPAAYAAPAAGQFGNAGRDSITGPSQFTGNASLQRTFRLDKRLSLNVRMDATNILNHVTFSAWNTTVGTTTFGAPASANGMRTMQLTSRLTF